MEEARQHPALTREQWLVSYLYLGGTLALCAGIALQLFLRIDALFPAILFLALTRVCLALWQLVRPRSCVTQRSWPGLVFVSVIWIGVAALLIWNRMR